MLAGVAAAAAILSALIIEPKRDCDSEVDELPLDEPALEVAA